MLQVKIVRHSETGRCYDVQPDVRTLTWGVSKPPARPGPAWLANRSGVNSVTTVTFALSVAALAVFDPQLVNWTWQTDWQSTTLTPGGRLDHPLSDVSRSLCYFMSPRVCLTGARSRDPVLLAPKSPSPSQHAWRNFSEAKARSCECFGSSSPSKNNADVPASDS